MIGTAAAVKAQGKETPLDRVGEGIERIGRGSEASTMGGRLEGEFWRRLYASKNRYT